MLLQEALQVARWPPRWRNIFQEGSRQHPTCFQQAPRQPQCGSKCPWILQRHTPRCTNLFTAGEHYMFLAFSIFRFRCAMEDSRCPQVCPIEPQEDAKKAEYCPKIAQDARNSVPQLYQDAIFEPPTGKGERGNKSPLPPPSLPRFFEPWGARSSQEASKTAPRTFRPPSTPLQPALFGPRWLQESPS